MPSSFLAEYLRDFKVAVIFLTRIPLRVAGDLPAKAIGQALRLAPLVGLLVGLAGGLVYWLMSGFGLPPLVCGLLAVGATILLTGALHEDGLADVADGLGGSGPEQKRAIMRDSRLGTFGAAALILSIGLRAAALAALGAGSALAALLAAHALSRALLPFAMTVAPAASGDGLAASAEVPEGRDVALALALGGLVSVFTLGLGGTLLAAILAAAAAGLLLMLAQRMIGGYTGDVLGAVQQVAEITVLLVAASLIAGGSE